MRWTILLGAWITLVTGCVSSRPTATVPATRSSVIATSMLPRSLLSLERWRKDPRFAHAIWGVLLENDGGESLFETNADILMTPASVRKLFAGAAVAECLGMHSRLETELWLDGIQRGSVFEGTVIIRGGGDPSLGGRYHDDRDRTLFPFVDAIRSRGIDKVDGSVLADVSFFARELIPDSWKVGNIGSTYAAPVDALAYNENVVGVRVLRQECGGMATMTDPPFVESRNELRCGATDSIAVTANQKNDLRVTGETMASESPLITRVAIQNPGLYAARALEDLLERNGVSVSGESRLSPTSAGGEKVAVIPSPFIYQLLGTVLRNSHNLYTEMLLRDIGLPSSQKSFADGARREREFLTLELGLDPHEFSFADGSGLSLDNMVTPRAVLRLLRYMDDPVRKQVYASLLATPGGEGTLRERLLPLTGRLVGKTGTVARVNALVGMVVSESGQRRRFAIIINNHLADGDEAEKAIDEIVAEMASM